MQVDDLTEAHTPQQEGEELAPIEQRVAEAQGLWKEEAKAYAALVAAFEPLSKSETYEDLSKLPALLKKIEQKAGELPTYAGRGPLVLEMVRADLRERVRAMREDLARELRAACDAAKLDMRVLRREEPVEVRIAPFSVVINREKGRSELRFARQLIDTCGAAADEIVSAYGKALEAMTSGFAPGPFFEACLRAWQAACGAGHGGAGERVEILDFLPYLALQMQSGAFRVEPITANYRGYTRARFAFDVMQLRNAGGLTRDGLRLNLGVATGTTASEKNRAIFFEDEHGNGEFKLTVFFTRSEGASSGGGTGAKIQ